MKRHDYVIDQAVVDMLAVALLEQFGHLLNSDLAWRLARVAVQQLVRIQESTGKDLIYRSDVE